MIDRFRSNRCEYCGERFFLKSSLDDHLLRKCKSMRDKVEGVLADYTKARDLQRQNQLSAQLGNRKWPNEEGMAAGQGIASTPSSRREERQSSYLPVADWFPTIGVSFGESESGAHRGDGGSFGGAGATESWSDSSSSSSSSDSSSSCDSGSSDSGGSCDSGGSSDSGF
jgi:hypothetical protein